MKKGRDFSPRRGKELKVREDDNANTVTSTQGPEQFIVLKANTKSGEEVAKEGDSINLSNPNSSTPRGRVGHGVGQTLDTQSNQAVITDSGYTNSRNSLDYYVSSPTLTNKSGELKVNNIRRLTEIECERLQGFQDDWTKFGNYDGVVKEIPKTQRYKLCGNAVTTAVVKAIASKLNFNL